MPQKYSKLSALEHERILKMAAQSIPTAIICEVLGRSKNSVYGVLKQYGIPSPRKQRKEQIASIKSEASQLDQLRAELESLVFGSKIPAVTTKPKNQSKKKGFFSRTVRKIGLRLVALS